MPSTCFTARAALFRANITPPPPPILRPSCPEKRTRRIRRDLTQIRVTLFRANIPPPPPILRPSCPEKRTRRIRRDLYQIRFALFRVNIPPPPPILRSNCLEKRTRPIRWDLTQIRFHLIESSVPLAGFKLEGPSANLNRRLHLETVADLLAHPPQHLEILPLTHPPPSPPCSLHSPRHLTDTEESPDVQEKEEAENCAPLRRSPRLAALVPPRRSARLAQKARVCYKE